MRCCCTIIDVKVRVNINDGNWGIIWVIYIYNYIFYFNLYHILCFNVFLFVILSRFESNMNEHETMKNQGKMNKTKYNIMNYSYNQGNMSNYDNLYYFLVFYIILILNLNHSNMNDYEITSKMKISNNQSEMNEFKYSIMNYSYSYSNMSIYSMIIYIICNAPQLKYDIMQSWPT